MTVTALAHGVRIRIHLQPGASRSEVAGMHGDRIRIRIKSPPVDGRANEELLRFVAELLGVPLRQVRLAAGAASRQKTIEVDGIDAGTAARILLG